MLKKQQCDEGREKREAIEKFLIKARIVDLKKSKQKKKKIID